MLSVSRAVRHPRERGDPVHGFLIGQNQSAYRERKCTVFRLLFYIPLTRKGLIYKIGIICYFFSLLRIINFFGEIS